MIQNSIKRVNETSSTSEKDALSKVWTAIKTQKDETSIALLQQENRITSAFDERVSSVEDQQLHLWNEIDEFRNILKHRGSVVNEQDEPNLDEEDASTDEPQEGTDEPQETSEEEKPQTIGDVWKTMIFVYLYAILLTVFIILYWSYFLDADFTDWSGKKYAVPVVDLEIYIRDFLYPGISIAMVGMGTFQVASFWESGVKEEPESKLVPYGLLEGLSFFIGMTTAIMGIQYSMWHYGKIDFIYWFRFDVLLQIVFGAIGGILLGKKLRYTAFYFFNGKTVDAITKDKIKARKRRRSSQIAVADILEETKKEDKGRFILILSIVVCCLYPMIIMKAYNSDNIHDIWRILFVSFIHPIISEVILLSLRNAKNDVKSVSFSEKLYLQNQAQVFYLELLLQLTRRIMVGCMHHQFSVYIAVALMSLEEGIMRSTFLERDTWYRQYLKQPPITKSERRIYRQIIAINIVNQMVVEVICIFMSKFLVIMTRRHRFLFNLGFQSVEITNQDLLIQLGLELFVEFAVDAIAVYKEIIKQRLKLSKYFSFLTKEVFLSYLFYSLMGVGLVFTMPFTSLPDIYFCKNADPCTCTGGSFRLYTSACKFLTLHLKCNKLISMVQ